MRHTLFNSILRRDSGAAPDDFHELELIMCGHSTLDMEDWMEHNQYMGLLCDDGPAHPCAAWAHQLFHAQWQSACGSIVQENESKTMKEIRFQEK